MSEGGVGRARCHRHKCVPRPRGTRKGGGVFEASDRQGQFMQRSETSGVRSALVVGFICFLEDCLVYKLLFELQFAERQNEEQ